jgi:hypothetical protein
MPEQKMTLYEAINMAESWVKDRKSEEGYLHLPLFETLQTLLDHVRQQSKDIEELTTACRVLFRRNKELENELRRGEKAGPSVDQGS